MAVTARGRGRHHPPVPPRPPRPRDRPPHRGRRRALLAWLRPIYPEPDRRGPPRSSGRPERDERRALRLGLDPERGLARRSRKSSASRSTPAASAATSGSTASPPGRSSISWASGCGSARPSSRWSPSPAAARPRPTPRPAARRRHACRARGWLGPHGFRRLRQVRGGRPTSRQAIPVDAGMTALPFPLADAPDDELEAGPPPVRRRGGVPQGRRRDGRPAARRPGRGLLRRPLQRRQVDA
jgi:hypothetical protein